METSFDAPIQLSIGSRALWSTERIGARASRWRRLFATEGCTLAFSLETCGDFPMADEHGGEEAGEELGASRDQTKVMSNGAIERSAALPSRAHAA